MKYSLAPSITTDHSIEIRKVARVAYNFFSIPFTKCFSLFFFNLSTLKFIYYHWYSIFNLLNCRHVLSQNNCFLITPQQRCSTKYISPIELYEKIAFCGFCRVWTFLMYHVLWMRWDRSERVVSIYNPVSITREYIKLGYFKSIPNTSNPKFNTLYSIRVNRYYYNVSHLIHSGRHYVWISYSV